MPSAVAPVQEAVDSFHEAALFPDRWPEALDSIAAALRSDGATLLVTPTRKHLVASSPALRPFVQQHFALPFPDPREQRVTPGLHEGFKADHAYFSPKEIAAEPYYQEFLVPRGFGWNAAAALGGGLLISLKRGSRGPYDADDLDALDFALPGLRVASRAATLSWRSNFSGQLDAFERIGRGALLIDERTQVVEVNACVQFGDGLDLSGGYLQAPNPADRLRLQRFLAIAAEPSLSPTVATGAPFSLPRPSGGRPWLLDSLACGEALHSLHSRAAALVLITDLERPSCISRQVLREVFALTGTEAHLAEELLQGRSLRAAAARLGISEGHARQRLKTIFVKTGTSRQVELVALLGHLRSS